MTTNTITKVTKKYKLAEKAAAIAKTHEFDYGCCPKCILAAAQETVENRRITDETIKASHRLSGVGGLTGVCMCDSLVGGLIVLGSKRGTGINLPRESLLAILISVMNSPKNFVKNSMTLAVKTATGITGKTYDMWKTEEYQEFSDNRGGAMCKNFRICNTPGC